MTTRADMDSSEMASSSALKYTEGPSKDAWEEHRELIIKLYYQMSLKELSEYMKREHGFHASKRMYDSRFRRWQVFKTMKKVDKEKLMRSVKRSPPDEGNPPSPKRQQVVPKNRVKPRHVEQRPRQLGLLAPKALVRPKHYPGPGSQQTPGGYDIRSERSHTAMALSPVSAWYDQSHSSSPETASHWSYNRSHHGTPGPDLHRVSASVQPSPAMVASIPAHYSGGSPMIMSPTSSNSEGGSPPVQSIELDDHVMQTASTSSNILPLVSTSSATSSTYIASPVAVTLSETLPSSSYSRKTSYSNSSAYFSHILDPSEPPAPVLPTAGPQRSIEIVLSSLSAYYDWHFSAQMAAARQNPLAFSYKSDESFSTRASQDFWDNINMGIYLLKFSNSTSSKAARPDRAFAAIQDGCTRASAALADAPFDFPLQLFARLSPNNTQLCLDVRTNLLGYLTSMALTKLGPRHPLTLICRALQTDLHDPDFSRCGFDFVAEFFRSRMPNCEAMEFKISQLQTKLKRKSGDTEGAAKQAQTLLGRSKEVFGPGASQTRQAASELAHAYMRWGGVDMDERAMVLCRDVVRKDESTETLSSSNSRVVEITASEESVAPPLTNVLHDDVIAAHAMEDIAELYERRHSRRKARDDLEKSVQWLERAAGIANKLMKGHVAALHITDKLSVLRETLVMA